ncbi:hypothetical protein M9Y10_018655 [Tritrichomonas musculus]|uniref:Uncharacterized protein n=1 Tax=Tritrichomonas musculus TaxID=1915356 RepID=A0ABR2HMA9_9EUKA
MFSSGELLYIDIASAIKYFMRCIENDVGKEINFNEYYFSYVSDLKYNEYLYYACNNLGLIYLTVFEDVEKATFFIREAGFNEYPVGQNNYGLLCQFYLNQIDNARYMYNKASKKKFALSDFNLGFLLETEGKKDESIQYYRDAIMNENNELIFHNVTFNDKRLEISKSFITCLANLKLTEYYLTKSNFVEAKKFFIKSFEKIINNSSYRFCYHFQHNSDFSYLKHFILNYPLFNLKNQPNLHSIFDQIMKKDEIYIKTERIIIETESILSENNFFNNLDVIEKTKINDLYFYSNNQEKLQSIIYLYKFNLSKEKVFESPDELFSYIIQDKNMTRKLIEEIRDIIDSIQAVLCTPPYNILFGRIRIEKPKLVKEKVCMHQKEIDNNFYKGFAIE